MGCYYKNKNFRPDCYQYFQHFWNVFHLTFSASFFWMLLLLYQGQFPVIPPVTESQSVCSWRKTTQRYPHKLYCLPPPLPAIFTRRQVVSAPPGYPAEDPWCKSVLRWRLCILRVYWEYSGSINIWWQCHLSPALEPKLMISWPSDTQCRMNYWEPSCQSRASGQLHVE